MASVSVTWHAICWGRVAGLQYLASYNQQLKIMNNILPLLTVLGTACITVSSLTAGEPAAAKLTGSAALDYNSHFISYGFDVWGGGTNPGGDSTLNPVVSLNYQLNEKWSFNAGFWLDVNDNKGPFETVETDTWVGVAYDAGLATYSATLQNWQYAEDSEVILDLGVSFDTFLSPSIKLHHRINEGGAASFDDVTGDQVGGFAGTFLVLGGSHSFDITESFSVSVPVAAAFALDEFHTTESGYGFASIGLQGSYSINDCTAFNFGLSYYDTDDQVVGNPDDNFFTYNAGMSFSF